MGISSRDMHTGRSRGVWCHVVLLNAWSFGRVAQSTQKHPANRHHLRTEARMDAGLRQMNGDLERKVNKLHSKMIVIILQYI